MVRVWDGERKRYEVKSTGETSAIKAREIAKDYARNFQADKPKQVDPQFTFNHFATKLQKKNTRLAANEEMNVGYMKSLEWALENGVGILDQLPLYVSVKKFNDFLVLFFTQLVKKLLLLLQWGTADLHVFVTVDDVLVCHCWSSLSKIFKERRASENPTFFRTMFLRSSRLPVHMRE